MSSLTRLLGGLMLCLVASVSISVLLALSSISNNCPTNQNIVLYTAKEDPSWGQHKLAVIVPFRDRFEELLVFVPHIDKFLNAQKVRHKIYVINQADKLRFNRASLINVGHMLSRNECDYLAMHDVDLLPLNPDLNYSYPSSGPFHIASPELHPKYHYPTFVGGVLLLTKEHFELVNGLSNRYWGWGLEDDEFFARMKDANLKVSRPQNIKTGTKDTFRHIHDRSMRRRDTARLYNQKESTRKRDRFTGLKSVKYKLVGMQNLVIDDAPLTLYHVKLECNKTLTPWCEPKPSSALKKQ